MPEESISDFCVDPDLLKQALNILSQLTSLEETHMLQSSIVDLSTVSVCDGLLKRPVFPTSTATQKTEFKHLQG